MNEPVPRLDGPVKSTSPELAGANGSKGLEWLWHHLGRRSFHVLHCGSPLQSTVDVLARCASRLYVGDLVSAARCSHQQLWGSSAAVPNFKTERLFSELPVIPPGSLSAVFCWQLLDLLPRHALAEVVRRLYAYLAPDSVLFFLVREPQLKTGADTTWYLETPTCFATRAVGLLPFQYPPISNRDMERLMPAGIAKTVLRRGGLREVLAVK